MSAAVRPLHWLGRHALACIEERVMQALEDWGREWVAHPLPQEVSARAACASSMPGETVRLVGSGGTLWFRPGPPGDALAGAVLGSDFLPAAQADTAAQAVLEQARQARDAALAAALVGATVLSDTTPPGPAMWCGHACGAVEIRCEALGVHLLADAGVLRHVPPRPHRPAPRAPLVPLLDAACDAAVRLQLDLGSVEMDLAHLMDLQPGDVLRLPTRLGERLPVRLGAEVVARGSLGQAGARKAVQLVSA